MRHAIACVASLPLLALLPFVAIQLSWAMSGLLGTVGGMGSCCGPQESTVEGTQVFVSPFQPALLLALAIVVLGATAAQRASARYPRAAWVIPLGGAVLGGGIVALASWAALPADLPPVVPVVVGLTATACLLLLVGYYATVLWAIQAWRAGPATSQG
ncbi:MAG: hypothetical protein AB7N24_23600 [Dehalococcoidia bacterium]